MGILKRWIPIIRHKLIHHLPLGISVTLRSTRDRCVYGRCVCCGGEIVSNSIESSFEWACTPGCEAQGCKYHYELLEEPCPPAECPLQVDPQVRDLREAFHGVIRKEILGIVRRHGYCTVQDHDDVRASLKKLRETGRITVEMYVARFVLIVRMTPSV